MTTKILELCGKIKLDSGKELDAFPDELEECENNA